MSGDPEHFSHPPGEGRVMQPLRVIDRLQGEGPGRHRRGGIQGEGATPHPPAIAARPRSLSQVTSVVAAPSASALAR